MTLREFIGQHPGEALDIMASEGRILLEPNQVQRLLDGKPVIACPKDLRKAAYVQAEDLLEQTVCSAYPTRSLWRLAVSYDPTDRLVRKHTGMMEWRLS